MPSDRGGGSVKSIPIPIHRSGSYTPSMLVNDHQLLSDRPQLYDCPRCKHHGETELKFVAGLFTWICFLVLLMSSVFIFPLFFLWVPFFVGTFKDVEHRCENCKAWIGTYRRIGKRL
ncbi:LITAF-like zinc ribbon domain-containing protein [Ditylenchus destructor]|uniref:LITAF-like zinc ribbon domain-containing protein n=1 Tax=Ditylenchus destructor TaxID=166010 RepID=A0AAD4R8M9_9BILA|nr:LITAF-like zinc ribbon domain-containing protein [Ditylenchus destructor]